jgi:hypothetical protein
MHDNPPLATSITSHCWRIFCQLEAKLSDKELDRRVERLNDESYQLHTRHLTSVPSELALIRWP